MKPPPPPEPVGELRLWASSDEADEASVSLAFFDTEREPGAPELDPDHVTKLLQAEPTRAMRRGAVLLDPQYHRIARTSSWRLQGPRLSDPPLEQQIRQFLARLPPPGPVWEELRPCKGQLFCGLFLQFWNRECHLSPELLLEVARRHISLRLDIYFEREEPDFSEDAE